MGLVSDENIPLLTGARKIFHTCFDVNSKHDTDIRAGAKHHKNRTELIRGKGKVRTKGAHIFVSERLQQQEQNSLEVLLPDAQAVLPGDLEQLQEGAFPFFHSLVVVGQLFQKVGHQVRMVNGHWTADRTEVTARGNAWLQVPPQ